MSSINFSASIPWHILRNHLRQQLEAVRELQDIATGEEVYRLQGESRRIKAMLNLPETLTMLQDQDEQDEKEREHATSSNK